MNILPWSSNPGRKFFRNVDNDSFVSDATNGSRVCNCCSRPRRPRVATSPVCRGKDINFKIEELKWTFFLIKLQFNGFYWNCCHIDNLTVLIHFLLCVRCVEITLSNFIWSFLKTVHRVIKKFCIPQWIGI